MLIVALGVEQEKMERAFPSPPDFSFVSRYLYRSTRVKDAEEIREAGATDFALTSQEYSRLLRRLEDTEGDGKGIVPQGEDGASILVEGVGQMGYDITAKSEPWRRGYYETLLGCARAAEFLDSCVKDEKRTLAFPKAVVIGPSNPTPRPMPPGSPPAPREEDCVPAFDPPEKFYMKILTTNGFTSGQKVDAALALANWLDFKGTHEAAGEMYRWALDIATSGLQTPNDVIDPTNYTLKSGQLPSQNVLKTTTAIAQHKAKIGELNSALPIFLSLLRARRSLPDAPPAPTAPAPSITEQVVRGIVSSIIPPDFPPPPPSGDEPPLRDAKERCEEAALMAFVGEILYATASGLSGQEDGLAWTREAVDDAESVLRESRIPDDAKKVCRECLGMGLGNWRSMVRKLAQEEKQRKAQGLSIEPPASMGGWFGWGASVPEEKVREDGKGRWAAEEDVVDSRYRRARDVLEAEQKDMSKLFIFR